jgi:protein O-mannosyl-transferase
MSKLSLDKVTQRATVGRPGRLMPMLVMLVTALAFLPVLSNNFVNWDDDKILTENPDYRGLGWQQIGWMFSTLLMGHYHPLTWISFALDYSIWGMNPFGYHLTNLLLHVGNAVMFYFVSRKLLRAALSPSMKMDVWQLDISAALAAVLFAIHPLRVESVAWATERRDVLSGFFYLASVQCYLGSVSGEQGSKSSLFVVALVSYFLSLLSKAIGITLPMVLLLIDVYPLRRLPGGPIGWLKPEYRKVLLEKIPFGLFAGAFAIVALLAQHTTGALKPLEQFDIISRLIQACFGYFFYFWKTVLPIRLSPIYELPIDVGDWFWLFVLGAVVTIAITAALILQRRRWPAALACWTYYLIVLGPVTGAAQSGPQLVADRYSYLACMSWPLLISGALLSFWQRRNTNYPHRARGQNFAATGIAWGVAMAFLGILTWQQSAVWRDGKSLWQHAVAVGPVSSIAHYNLGRSLERENDPSAAIEHYRKAIQINQSHSKAHYNLARLLALNGLEAEAMTHYRRVLEIRPDHADAHNDLGLLLELSGDVPAAFAEFRKAIEIDAMHQKALFNLAELLAKQGDLASAAANYERAAHVNPNEAVIQIRWAITLARQGHLEAAESHFRRAVELKPDDTHARVLLARALAGQGKTEEAERIYQEALQVKENTGKNSWGKKSQTK